MAATAIASAQHHTDPKAVDADGHGAGKGLADDKISIKSTPCERFSIRGYVATIRKIDRKTSWPFPQHLLEIRLKEAGNLALPPLEIPKYRWWNCKNCLGDISTYAESSIENEYMRDAHASLQDYDVNIDHGCLMFGMYLHTSSADLQEKQNMLDHSTETVETPTFELKSGDAVGSSAHATNKEKRAEEVVTDTMSEHRRTESTVPMELEKDNYEIADFQEKESGISHCVSNFRNSEGFINMTKIHHHQQDEKGAGPETGQAIMETTPSMLVNKTNEELGSKQNKSEALQIPCQDPNSWEYFSRNKNVFKEMSEKMKGKEMEQATSPILASELDANKLKNISNVPVSFAYGENAEPGQHVLVEKNGQKTISKGVESLTVQTKEFNIQNKDDSHRASGDGNDVPCLSGNQSSWSEHMETNKLTKGKECTDLSTSQASLEKGNVLVSELTGKLKISESRSKRRPQKRRSIADIIASESSHPKSWNKDTQESKSADIMKENMYRTENNEQFYLTEDYINDPKDAVIWSSKPTTKTNGISEVNIDAEINNVILKKRHQEKLKVTKKHHSIGIQSLDARTLFFEKNSSGPSFSEAATDALQLPQSTSHLASVSKDKALQRNFLNPEYGQRRKKFSEMEDEIPMDIVELMAKNQHERGLSNPKRLHKSHNLQKDERRLKMKKADPTHVNKHVEEGAGLKQDMVTPKSKAWPKQTGQENLQGFLRKQSGNDFLVDYGRIDVSGVNATDNLVTSNKESITSGSCKDHLAMLQSTQWFNPWGKYSPEFVAPILDETNAACNLPFPIDCNKSHVSVTHCDQYGAFSTNGTALDSMQLLGASSYCGYMEMQNLCREGTPALSYFTNPVLPVFQNKSESFLNYNEHSHQNLINTDSPLNLPRESLDLGVSGSKFNIPPEPHKGNGIPNLSVRTDGISHPLYFNGQSNSALLQQVNAQARQTSGKKYCFPSTPVLRLMGQSVSVPVTCADKKSMAAENGDNRNFSNLPQGSSQKHVSWFHPATCASSGVMEMYQNETFTGAERMFTGSEPIQDSTHMREQIISSVKTIPPVPKFMPSGHLASNVFSGISTPSCTVPGKGNVALESSLLQTKSPFHGTPFPEKKQKKGLPCTSGYNGNLQTFSIIPPASQSTKVAKGSSSTKGLRSYRPTPTSVHLNGYQRSALDIYLQDGHKCLQSPWVLGSNPKQNLTKEPKKTQALNKENEESALCGKKACNVEICTLNQNPAEINIEEEEDGYNFGYDHLASSYRALPHSERKINMAIPQGQKRRRTLKKKNLQEFLVQKDVYVGDLANRNVDNLDPVEQEVTSVKELDGNIT
jgi:hypothetical protein